jgi:hypothetical protein
MSVNKLIAVEWIFDSSEVSFSSICDFEFLQEEKILTKNRLVIMVI